MTNTVYVRESALRKVSSLGPHLFRSLTTSNARMSRDLMTAEDAADCRWIGYGIGKGVTWPEAKTSVFGIPETATAGLHGQLIQGFCHVDPAPLCYDDAHIKGFGGFVRWVFFADPNNVTNFLGIDFSLPLRPTAGVATTFVRAYQVVHALAEHGIPLDAEVVLLNCRMCEPGYMTEVRRHAGLITVGDWQAKGKGLFFARSNFCARCGQQTLINDDHIYCSCCGQKRNDRSDAEGVVTWPGKPHRLTTQPQAHRTSVHPRQFEIG